MVKEELTNKPYQLERLKAMMAAFVKANGHFSWSSQHATLTLYSSYSKVAQLMYQTSQKLFHLSPHFAYKTSLRFSKRRVYEIVFDQQAEHVLASLGLSLDAPSQAYAMYWRDADHFAGYLAGLFLASGSVNDPNTSHYHLELASEDEAFLIDLLKAIKRLKSYRFSFKLARRKHRYILYLKKSDEIADFLIFLGATESTLDFEAVRVARDFSNSENRLQICETANMRKTIEAAKKQIEDIVYLDKVIGLDKLDHPKLVALCKLRLEHDSSSLEELSMMLSEQFPKGVSKSNLNHWFRSLHQLANKMRGHS
jgi:DNA-binding protein WhiA